MNTSKLIGIAHRIKVTKPGQRAALVSELLDAIDERDAAPSLPPKTLEHHAHNNSVAETLRDMLNDDGARDNPRALPRIARVLRDLR